MVPLQNMDSSFERLLGGKKQKNQKVEKNTFSFDIELVPYTDEHPAEYNWKVMVEQSAAGRIPLGPELKAYPTKE